MARPSADKVNGLETRLLKLTSTHLAVEVPFTIDLTRIPIGVMEKIMSYLDGTSVITLRRMSGQLERIIDETLVGKIGRKFWLRRCFQEFPRMHLVRMIASYRSTIESWERYIEEDQADDCCYTLPISNFKWRHIYNAVNQLRGRCSGKLEIVPLEYAESCLKADIRIIFTEHRATGKRPIKLTSTSGSTLFRVQHPSLTHVEQEHLFVFENMDTYRRGVQVVTHRDKIRTVRVINLPIPKRYSDYPEALLPKPGVVLIICSTRHVAVAPLHKGKLLRIELEQNDYEHRHSPYLPSEDRYAIWGNNLGVWINQDLIQIFEISLAENTADVALTLIKSVSFGHDLHTVWNHIAAEPNSHVPALRLGFRNPYTTKAIKCPTFCFLCPTRESYEITYGEYDTQTKITTGIIKRYESMMTGGHKVNPKILGMGPMTGRVSEHHVVAFWNPTWLVVLYSRGMWIYQELTSRLFTDPNEQLDYVECQTEKLFVLGTNLHIYLTILSHVGPSCLKSRNDPDYCIWFRGQLQFEVLRKIPLTCFLPNPSHILTHVHYDMDRGRPYFFIVTDLPDKDRTAYSYKLLKIQFEQGDEQLNEQGEQFMITDPDNVTAVDLNAVHLNGGGFAQ